MFVKSLRTLMACAAIAALATTPMFAAEPHGGMLRNPDVGPTHIVFSYANDLWIAPREGGTAVPLASPEGAETFPRFSPDGSTIAFMGNYDGNTDLYTVPAGARHAIPGDAPSGDRALQRLDSRWAAALLPPPPWNGTRGHASSSRFPRPVACQDKMPVPYGSTATISADGTWLAYTPHTYAITAPGSATAAGWPPTSGSSTWKPTRPTRSPIGKARTPSRCGTATASTTFPTAGPEHRKNIWVYDITSGSSQPGHPAFRLRRQVAGDRARTGWAGRDRSTNSDPSSGCSISRAPRAARSPSTSRAPDRSCGHAPSTLPT